MSAPTLAELPPPPPGRRGWPWTEAGPPVPPALPDGRPWPRITLVTPSYNQAAFVEETLRSALLQGYPNLEYIVVDGASADGSAEVIRRYAPWIDHWASEPDRGQSHAINKGLARAGGEIFNWLNSDDQLTPGALAEVGRLWRLHGAHVVTGRSRNVAAEGRALLKDWRPAPPHGPLDLVRAEGTLMLMPQPSTFLPTAELRATGGVREDLHFIMDWELHFRLARRHRGRLRVVASDACLSVALHHAAAKTSRIADRIPAELDMVLRGLRPGELTPLEWARLLPLARRLHLWLRVAEARAGARPGRSLLGLAARRPDFLLSRFFLGALRRELIRPAGRAGAG